MKRAVMILLTALTALGAESPAALSAAETKALFNGRDLTGWTTFIRDRGKGVDPNGVFTVQDGVIRISGEEYGGITTDESFSNYKLTLEFKWGTQTWGKRKEKARDSGVLIHSYGDDGGFHKTWMRSIEANVVEGGIGDFWMVTDLEDGDSATCDVVERSGVRVFDPERGEPVTIFANAEYCFGWSGRDPNWRDELGFRGENDIDRPGEWNEITVTARDREMEVYVNGTLVNRVYNLTRAEGKIQLQSEGAEIFYRNITVEKL